MLELLLLIFFSVTTADPMLYMFPTNPELHPAGMYPNHQFSRGKVRDLPDSGVIYLNRIKPIGEEFKGLVDMENEHKELKTKSSKSSSSFERYNSEEERAPATARPTTPVMMPVIPVTQRTLPPIPIVQPDEIQFVSLTKPEKISEPKKSVQKTKLSVPEEAELDFLLNDLLKNKGTSKNFPKIGRSATAKRHIGGIKPKLIGFDGTARVGTLPTITHTRPVVQHGIPTSQFKSRSSPVTVRLKPRKLYTTGGASKYSKQGPDFDPWERMGQ